MYKLNSVLKIVVENAASTIDPRKIWLFGSRAREDNSSRSDYDIAIEASSYKKWSEFVDKCEKLTPTMCELNFVKFENASEEIKKSIFKEGKLIYDRDKISTGSRKL